MRKSRKAIQAEKRNYIARLSLLLSSDYRSEVEKVRYIPEEYDEYAEITFRGGHIVVVDITADSCGEIYKDIGQAVYGK